VLFFANSQILNIIWGRGEELTDAC